MPWQRSRSDLSIAELWGTAIAGLAITACLRPPSSLSRACQRASSSSVGLTGSVIFSEIAAATVIASAFVFTKTIDFRPVFDAATARCTATRFAFGVSRTRLPRIAPANVTGRVGDSVCYAGRLIISQPVMLQTPDCVRRNVKLVCGRLAKRTGFHFSFSICLLLGHGREFLHLRKFSIVVDDHASRLAARLPWEIHRYARSPCKRRDPFRHIIDILKHARKEKAYPHWAPHG